MASSSSLGITPTAAFATHLPAVFHDRLGLDLVPLPGEPSDPQFDLGFTLQTKDGSRRLLVAVKSRWLHRHVDTLRPHFLSLDVQREIPLLAIPVLSRQIRRDLRAAGINHMDLRGTLYVQAEGLHIDIERADSDRDNGEVAIVPGSPIGSPTVNPFADRASVVLRLLFQDPARTWRVDELAQAGATTPGWVSRVAHELERRGYVRRSQRGSGHDSDLQLADPVAVLRDWATAYTWRTNHLVSYHVPLEPDEVIAHLCTIAQEIVQHDDGTSRARPIVPAGGLAAPVALTLLSASDRYASHVEHEQVHVYIGHTFFGWANDVIQRRLHAEPAERSGNLHVLQPYYRHSVFLDARLVDDVPVVSPVQLYVDLLHYPLRGPEVASVLAQRVLGPALGLSLAQVQELTT